MLTKRITRKIISTRLWNRKKELQELKEKRRKLKIEMKCCEYVFLSISRNKITVNNSQLAKHKNKFSKHESKTQKDNGSN